MRLKNKVALITGAAAGIGKDTALVFAREGARLILADIKQEGVEAVATEIRQGGGQAVAMRQDVSDEQQWIDTVQAGVQAFGTVDILFNNAGIYEIKPLLDTTVQDWNHLMAINVTSVFLGMKHVVPLMQRQRSGSIVNASSVAGLRGAVNHVLYGASKGAVRMMTKDAAMEFARDNIRVNSIHPGYIRTEMVEYASKVSGRTMEQIGKKFPLGRVGEVREVANTVLFLASDELSFITGCEFVIDGGSTS